MKYKTVVLKLVEHGCNGVAAGSDGENAGGNVVGTDSADDAGSISRYIGPDDRFQRVSTIPFFYN